MATKTFQTDYGQTTSQKDWSFRKFHMTKDRGGLNAGTFMTSEAVFIAAGPPRLKDLGNSAVGTSVYPIGVADNVSVSQNKLLQQIFEIGARRSYFVSGRVTGSLAISRPMFNGPSLLRAMLGGSKHKGMTKGGGLADNQPPGLFYNNKTGIDAGGVVPPKEDSPEFWSNLQAEIFDYPLGVYLYMVDQRERPYGGMYVEDCMVQAHAFNLAAQGITIPENISMMFDRIVPTSIIDNK